MIYETDDVFKISITDYLQSINIPTRKDGELYKASSPFSNDSNWSFCIYPTNTFYDWSNGFGGNILNLVGRINNITTREAYKLLRQGLKQNTYESNYTKRYTPKEIEKKTFDYKKYINTRPEECEQIKEYATSRGITSGYEYGYYSTRVGDSWVRHPAMMFLHRDKALNICGAKFRRLINEEPRFSARGSLGFYLAEVLMEKSYLKPVLYVVEGEINAITLGYILKKHKTPGIVISLGAVSNKIKLSDLPEQYQNLPIKIIIDYDGDEALYQERLKLYSELGNNATPIRIILPKGADLNSMYNLKKSYLIENLLWSK